MKILVIGDLHGKDLWKSIVGTECDKIVFTGDYMDDYYIEDVPMTNNLLDIIAFKKANMDKVVCLLGNHDIPYFYSNHDFSCTGHRFHMYTTWHNIFNENKELFQVAYQYKDYLFSHAGVSTGWLKTTETSLSLMPAGQLGDKLNQLANSRYFNDLYRCGHIRGGWHRYGGIVWADRSETVNNPLKGYHQIVGHTPISEPIRYMFKRSSITYVDCLNNKKKKQFLLMDDNDGEMKMSVVTPDSSELLPLTTQIVSWFKEA